MKNYLIISVFLLCAAMPERSEAESFVTDRASPLKLIKPGKGPALIAQFQGSVQVSGRLLFIRDLEVRRSRDLRVLFYPDQVSAKLLPRAATTAPVKELLISNSKEAVSILLDEATAQKLLNQELRGVEIEATVTIGEYRSVVECDRRWYLARLISAVRKQEIVVGTRENVGVGCG